MKKTILIVFSLFILSFAGLTLADDTTIENNIKFFTNLCDQNKNDKKPVKNSILLLIDATDPVKPKSANAQNLRDNFINNFDWSEEGDRVSIAVLSDKSVVSLDYVTMCAPVPESKITPTMAKLQIKKQNRAFKEALSYKYEKLIESNQSVSKQTSLIEAIVEVYRSKRYGFDDANSKRHLIIASDLYQNTDQISFYKLCKGNACPSFKESLKDKEVDVFMNRFAKLQTNTDRDSVEIYQFQPRSKINFSITDWWTDYFHFTGINKINIHH